MSKRESDSTPDQLEKKLKSENKQEIAIDSELLGHHTETPDSNNAFASKATAVQAVANAQNATLATIQPTSLPPPANKPQHGTEEWHRLRRENHKEVERRRRESINHGIKELAALIPTSDTNKAQILQRAVEFIKRLKENENNNIEKWTLEKLLTEQAVSELDASNTKLKQELERAYREVEHWKRLANEKK